MRLRLLVPGMIALVFLVSACLPAPELRSDKLLHGLNLIVEADAECAPPCWRDIVPGETEWRDALIIIEDAVEFENVTVEEVPDTGIRQALWQEGADGEPCCQMFSTEDGETVSVVFLRTAPELTMSQLVERWGEPSYLRGVEFTDDQAIMNLIYPDVPMVVYAFVAGAAEGILSESSEIIGVLYMTPDDMDLLLQTNELHAWDGYGAFSEYEAGEFEVTPSVTITPTPEEG